ncbi:MAG: peptide chain release factor N(5)-glutamine methyltransferase [Deltaproteobacteria bacterium]|nr:peptide chain release factor N(5)-glutamine methyltransferase [Deltaproteobacteria bacterium]
MTEPWTIRTVVAWTEKDLAARGIESARLEADLLLAHVLGTDRMSLYLDRDRPLSADELRRYREVVARRRKREPIAYILGEREFYGLPLVVDRRVLVPRPDTETLVERALELLASSQSPRVLDLGTGSGAIAIAIAVTRPDVRVDAVDASSDALEIASKNASRHAVGERVRLLHGDLFAPVAGEDPYDLVVSNPPYIAEPELATLPADVRDHEPHLALVEGAGVDGLGMYRRIARDVGARLVAGGHVAVEVGAGQSAAVATIFADVALADVAVRRDLGGIERVVSARRA